MIVKLIDASLLPTMYFKNASSAVLGFACHFYLLENKYHYHSCTDMLLPRQQKTKSPHCQKN